VKAAYLETVAEIERLYRQFLDVVKDELDALGVDDINNVQAMILYNIGHDELTVGELTQRGCYMGTNVTYNLKKLIESDYVTQQRSPRDRRSVRVRASKRGLELFGKLDAVFDAHVEGLNEVTDKSELKDLNTRLRVLGRFWTDARPASAGGARRTRHAA